MAQTQQPSHRAFVVIKREGQDDYWLPIGAAFPHHSGDGYNLILQALPIPDGDGVCKIVLRPPKEDDNDRRPQERNDRQERGDRDDRNNKSGSRRR
jgi:hypothetical protein